jgi:hypothetical protein
MADPKPPFREEEDGAAPASSRLPRGDYRPESTVNPPPRFLPAAYRVPPGRMIDAVLAAFRAEGIVVESVDRGAGLVRGGRDMGAGAVAVVTVSVAETDAGGSRLLLSFDRPPGARMDPVADERRLRALLDRVDADLAR